jgi:hypothetical protein
MYTRFALFKKKGIHLKPHEWDDAFATQTGHNVNAAANGNSPAASIARQLNRERA